MNDGFAEELEPKEPCYQYTVSNNKILKKDLTNIIMREMLGEKDVLFDSQNTMNIFKSRDTKQNMENTKEFFENLRGSIKG